jgi:site-specific DNA-methyltransferase (cytosine-N4-specific)
VTTTVLIVADARDLPLRDGCVQTVVTSPPYWGIRDYGKAEQIGLEPDLDTYVSAVVLAFREVWRVLRDDGTAWVNLGDGYDAGTRTTRCPSSKAGKHGYWTNPLINLRTSTDMGAKQMLAIPWRVALALQADGWILRCDVVWHKPNPMPESVKDRPTKAHEYVFLFSKRERYHYDAEAIKEPVTGTAHARGNGVNPKAAGKNERTGDRRREGFNERWRVKQNASFSGAINGLVDDRNCRSVWTIPTRGYDGAHFATFPEALVEPCILAGCPVGGLVCDPFIGSGTVGAVAERLGRRWVGVDLSYQELAQERTAQRGIRW